MSDTGLPYVICHMCETIDGKQITERFSKPFYAESWEKMNSPYGKISQDYKANAVMYGRNTVEEGFFKEHFDYKNHKPAAKHEPFKGELKTQRFALLADPEGLLVYDKNTVREQNIIVMLSEQVSEKYMAMLREKNVSYVFAGKDGYDCATAFRTLRAQFGIERIIVQGGGTLNGALLNAGLINEISVVIAPCIDGLTGVPSIYNYLGAKDDLPAKGQSLEFLGSQVFDQGFVWNHYKVHKV